MQCDQNILTFSGNINIFIPDYVVPISDDSILQSHCCENLKLHNPRRLKQRGMTHWHAIMWCMIIRAHLIIFADDLILGIVTTLFNFIRTVKCYGDHIMTDQKGCRRKRSSSIIICQPISYTWTTTFHLTVFKTQCFTSVKITCLRQFTISEMFYCVILNRSLEFKTQSFHRQARLSFKVINCWTSSEKGANMVALCMMMPHHTKALLMFMITCMTVLFQWKISQSHIF
jgi:hypothetical protein